MWAYPSVAGMGSGPVVHGLSYGIRTHRVSGLGFRDWGRGGLGGILGGGGRGP